MASGSSFSPALGRCPSSRVLVTLMCEGLIISLDLGHPLRVYRFLITPNFGSMLFWLVASSSWRMWIIYLTWLYFICCGSNSSLVTG